MSDILLKSFLEVKLKMRPRKYLSLPRIRALTSDWFVNSFTMTVYEKLFFKVQ